MTDLIDTTEMYLRTIYELIEDGVVPMRARIAERFDHSGPTVSQTVARMERDGLVVVTEGDRHLELTEEGWAQAVRVMRKHRLAERLLTDVIGLDLPHVHEEACRWEHVMSDRVERRLLEILDGPERSPYGNAIPGLAELGAEEAAADPDGTVSAQALADAGGGSASVVRIGEGPQTEPDVLEALVAAGVVPGARVRVSGAGDRVALDAGAGEVRLVAGDARHAFVLPIS